MLRFLAECPDSYRCFYQGQKIDKSSPGYERLLYAAEALTNYIENVVSQLPSMDEKLAEAWRRFIVDAYRRSPAVQDHLRENESWYDPALITLLGALVNVVNMKLHYKLSSPWPTEGVLWQKSCAMTYVWRL